MSGRGVLLAALLAWCALGDGSLVRVAHADARSDAKIEFERGRAAHARQEYAEAARAFARADELAPNAVALTTALEDALHAEAGALALALADRAEQRADGSAKLRAAASTARTRFGGSFGKVQLACKSPTEPCTASTDEVSFTVAQYLAPGRYTIRVEQAGRGVVHSVDVRAGESVTLDAPTKEPTLDAPTKEPTREERAAPTRATPAAPVSVAKPEEVRRGLPPSVFWGGLIATGALAVGGIAAEIYTASAHSKFVEEGCAVGGGGDCESRARTGKLTQTLGAGLLVGAGVIGVANVALALFAVDFKRGAKVSAAATPRGASASLTVSF